MHTRVKKPGSPNQTPIQTQKASQIRKSQARPTELAMKHWIPIHIGNDRLSQSIDIITENAEGLFYNSEYKNCINVLDELSHSILIFMPDFQLFY